MMGMPTKIGTGPRMGIGIRIGVRIGIEIGILIGIRIGLGMASVTGPGMWYVCTAVARDVVSDLCDGRSR